jgi:hypothetical protein
MNRSATEAASPTEAKMVIAPKTPDALNVDTNEEIYPHVPTMKIAVCVKRAQLLPLYVRHAMNAISAKNGMKNTKRLITKAGIAPGGISGVGLGSKNPAKTVTTSDPMKSQRDVLTTRGIGDFNFLPT